MCGARSKAIEFFNDWFSSPKKNDPWPSLDSSVQSKKQSTQIGTHA